MSTLRSLILAMLACVAFAASAPAVLGAGATTETFRDTVELIDDHGDEVYLFHIEAVSHLTTRPDGTMSVTYNVRQVQTHTVLGAVVDVIVSNSAQHSLSLDGQTFVSHFSGHDRYRAGGESCQTTYLWQLVDDELVMQHFKIVCP